MAQKERCQFGFMRVAPTDLGFVGGLLVTNHMGKPLEFQCTTPVRPNKTQEILYGPTLQPFIYSELIGKTLIERLNVKPQMVIVQQTNLLELRREVSIPVACVMEDDSMDQFDGAEDAIQLGMQWLQFHSDFMSDRSMLEEIQQLVPDDADLSEPLERVKDALQETIRAGAVA